MKGENDVEDQSLLANIPEDPRAPTDRASPPDQKMQKVIFKWGDRRVVNWRPRPPPLGPSPEPSPARPGPTRRCKKSSSSWATGAWSTGSATAPLPRRRRDRHHFRPRPHGAPSRHHLFSLRRRRRLPRRSFLPLPRRLHLPLCLRRCGLLSRPRRGRVARPPPRHRRWAWAEEFEVPAGGEGGRFEA